MSTKRRYHETEIPEPFETKKARQLIKANENLLSVVRAADTIICMLAEHNLPDPVRAPPEGRWGLTLLARLRVFFVIQNKAVDLIEENNARLQQMIESRDSTVSQAPQP